MSGIDVLTEQYSLEEELPGSRHVARWAGVHPETGEALEVLVLRTPVIHPPAAREAFAQHHRALAAIDSPSVVDTLEVGVIDGEPFVVRRRLGSDSMDAVRGPLAPEAVAAIGAALVPAVLALGPLTAGSLQPEDVLLDDDGRPVLAPTGRLRAEIPLDRLRWAAPEAWAGSEPTGAAGLYGLGQLLFRLATGADAFPATARSDTHAAAPSARAVRPGIPEALDRALSTLMSPDPALRAGALPGLEALALGPVDLRASLVTTSAQPRSASRVLTTRDVSPQRVGRELALRAAVVLDARALERATPSQRSVVAGLADVSIDTLQDLVEHGLPLVIEPAASGRAARARATALIGETHLPVSSVSASSWWRVPATMAAALVPAVVAMAGVTLGATLLGTPALLVAAVAALLMIALPTAAWRLGTSSGLPQARRAQALQQQAAATGGEAEVRRRLSRLRRLVPALDLPEAVEIDLRGGLRDVERQLESLSRALGSAQAGASGADLNRLRRDLLVLERSAKRDPGKATERDRAARAVADLEQVVQTRTRLEERMSALQIVLDEIAGVMATWGDRHAADDLAELDAALGNLGDRVRLVQETMDADGGGARGGRERQTT